jgi:hypothetical protein
MLARMLLTDESQVRKVIHDFNRRGFESLRPRFGGGRPRRIQTDVEQRIVAVAGARPDTLGVPYTRWSLSKLSRYLHGQGLVVSAAQLGRILALYREQPANGVVWTPAIRRYADANNVELVPTPTYASYLNRIESTEAAKRRQRRTAQTTSELNLAARTMTRFQAQRYAGT